MGKINKFHITILLVVTLAVSGVFGYASINQGALDHGYHSVLYTDLITAASNDYNLDINATTIVFGDSPIWSMNVVNSGNNLEFRQSGVTLLNISDSGSLSVQSLCLSGACRSTWPAGGGSGGVNVSDSGGSPTLVNQIDFRDNLSVTFDSGTARIDAAGSGGSITGSPSEILYFDSSGNIDSSDNLRFTGGNSIRLNSVLFRSSAGNNYISASEGFGFAMGQHQDPNIFFSQEKIFLNSTGLHIDLDPNPTYVYEFTGNEFPEAANDQRCACDTDNNAITCPNSFETSELQDADGNPGLCHDNYDAGGGIVAREYRLDPTSTGSGLTITANEGIQAQLDADFNQHEVKGIESLFTRNVFVNNSRIWVDNDQLCYEFENPDPVYECSASSPDVLSCTASDVTISGSGRSSDCAVNNGIEWVPFGAYCSEQCQNTVACSGQSLSECSGSAENSYYTSATNFQCDTSTGEYSCDCTDPDDYERQVREKTGSVGSSCLGP